MSAYFESGFSVREPAWHGLAKVLEDYPGREEAMEAAGHNFEILERLPFIADNDGAMELIPGWKVLIREDKGEKTEFDGRPLGMVKSTYETVQNDVIWDLIDALVESENVKYETAGVLKEGAVLWVLARIDEPSTVTGDDTPIYPYCLASTTHDGSGSIRASCVNVRVICWNTYSAAESESAASGRQFSFRHTKSVFDRIDVAKKALFGVRAEHSAFMELAEELAALPVSDAGLADFASRFIPDPSADIVTDRVRNNIVEARGKLTALFDGQTIAPGIRNTAYGCFQAGTEYLDHVRPYRTKESYFNRSVYRPERMKQHLIGMVKSVAEDDGNQSTSVPVDELN